MDSVDILWTSGHCPSTTVDIARGLSGHCPWTQWILLMIIVDIAHDRSGQPMDYSGHCPWTTVDIAHGLQWTLPMDSVDIAHGL